MKNPGPSIVACTAIIDAGKEGKKNFPQNLPFAHFNRGTAYANEGDQDRAIADFGESIQLRPDYAEAHYNRGIAYDRKGDYDRANADYDTAIPDFDEAIADCPSPPVVVTASSRSGYLAALIHERTDFGIGLASG